MLVKKKKKKKRNKERKKSVNLNIGKLKVSSLRSRGKRMKRNEQSLTDLWKT